MTHSDEFVASVRKRSVWPIVGIVVAALTAIGGTSLFLTLGLPGTHGKTPSRLSLLEEVQSLMPLNSYQTDNSVQTASVGDVEPMIAALANRLQLNPDDAEGWRMLGWSYFNTERYGQAAEAYRRAADLRGDDADLYSAYGEALVRAAQGQVTATALAVLDKTLELNPGDARARFFQGMAQEQAGNAAGALDIWIDVLKTAPNDAEWITGLHQRIDELALAHSIDVSDRLQGIERVVEPTPGTVLTAPSREEITAAKALPDADRQAMIEGMVDGLEQRLSESPQDIDGWIRLMRSRLVLNDADGAERALNRARLVFYEDPDASVRITTAASDLGMQAD
ncbi:MAG: tetratricopeptide repeat protein [Rhodobacteraceae bacterium]|nr:tetratricopeptide repeat protein [Paracoccaceae bacterium]